MNQPDLLEQLDIDLLNTENAPVLDLELEAIAAVNRCIRTSGLGRDRFVDRVNLCMRGTGRKVTKLQVNKWLATSQDNCIPAWVMPAICWAVGSIEPMGVLLNSIGFKPADMRADFLRRKAELDIEGKLRKQETLEIEKAMLAVMGARNAR